MRVFSCKSYCPFFCSSKSSSSVYSPCSVKFEDAQHVSSSPPPVDNVLEEEVSDENPEVVKDGNDVEKVEVKLKSILKRPIESNSDETAKGGVKWMDCIGKELEEIREFDCRVRYGNCAGASQSQTIEYGEK